jgi:hypothetical protein
VSSYRNVVLSKFNSLLRQIIVITLTEGGLRVVKKAIKAKEAVADIRSGMDDAALMEKYRLSPHELGDLFDKLLSAGLITQVDLNRKHFLNDHTVDLREETLSFTEALQQVGLIPPGSGNGDGDFQSKLPIANHTLNESTKEEEALSHEKGSSTLPEAKVSAQPYETPWYDRPTLVVLLLIGLFPLGLYALYRNSTFSAGIKSLLIVGWVLLVIIYLVLISGQILPEAVYASF